MANVATAILNISPQKELNRLDQMILRTKEFQKELDYRKEVEDEVFRLFSEGKFEEGKELLDKLDDEKIMALAEPVNEQSNNHVESKITTAEAAAILNASPQFVRVAMQRGILNIGIAMQMPNSNKWTYNISPKLLGEYSGKNIEYELERLRGEERNVV